MEKTDVSPTRIKLVISADTADLGPIKQHTLAHFRHTVKVPGFRAGTAPMALIEKHVEQRLLLDEFMEHALNQLYGQAVQQENLRPVGQPNVQIKKFVPFSDMGIEVETDTIGKITLPDYKKIKLEKKPASATIKDVNQVIKELKQNLVEQKKADKTIKVDDAFAAKIGPFKTLAELKADIKKHLTSQKQLAAERDFENRLISAIVAKSKVEIPGSMIDEDVARLEEEEKRDLVLRGQTWEEHLKDEGITEQEHRNRQRPRSEERIKAGIILGEIADKEGISVAPGEIDTRIKLLKGQYKDEQMQAELDKPQARRDIEARLLTEKTVAKLTDYAS